MNDSDDEQIDRESVVPGSVTEGITIMGRGYGANSDIFNYFINTDRSAMLYLYINTGKDAMRGLLMDPRDAEIMGLQLIYQARKMMAEKGDNQ